MRNPALQVGLSRTRLKVERKKRAAHLHSDEGGVPNIASRIARSPTRLIRPSNAAARQLRGKQEPQREGKHGSGGSPSVPGPHYVE